MGKKPLILILLLILALSSAVLLKLSFSKGWFVAYLSVNKPASPEILILEGWVSDTTVRLAAKEFHDRPYSRIFTSGSPTDPNYLLAEDGYLEFSFQEKSLMLESKDTISFTLRGSPVQGTFPEYKIFINDQEVAGGFTSLSWETYSYIIPSSTAAKKISISFVNDSHHMGEDRNLEVKCLRVNSELFMARARNVLHFKLSDPQRLSPRFTYYASVAEKCAHDLQMQDIPADLIDAVPSTVSIKNRTLASAIKISIFMEKQALQASAVNIMSEGIHARRTWISYRYALRGQADMVGIISVPSARSYNPDLQEYTNKEIIKELVSIVYYKYFFNKKRYRKELTGPNPKA